MLYFFKNYEFIRQASDSKDEVVLCRMIEPDPQDPEPIFEDA